MWTSLRGRCWSSSVLTGRARASCLKRLPCCNGPARAGCSSRGEPSSALDEPTREELLDDLSVALGETGVTTVFVTHDRGEAMRLGGRMVVLMNGEVRQVGPGGGGARGGGGGGGGGAARPPRGGSPPPPGAPPASPDERPQPPPGGR